MNILRKIEDFGDNMHREMGYIRLLEWDYSIPAPKISQGLIDALERMNEIEKEIYAAFAIPSELFKK